MLKNMNTLSNFKPSRYIISEIRSEPGYLVPQYFSVLRTVREGLKNTSFYPHIVDKRKVKKSRIQETPNNSNYARSSTNIFYVGVVDAAVGILDAAIAASQGFFFNKKK